MITIYLMMIFNSDNNKKYVKIKILIIFDKKNSLKAEIALWKSVNYLNFIFELNKLFANFQYLEIGTILVIKLI